MDPELLRGLTMRPTRTIRFPLQTAQTAVFLALTVLCAVHCAPEPRNVPCSNDGQCQKANEEFRYCLQSRCVECVGSASCGEGNVCMDGECVIHCKTALDCPKQQACNEGICKRM